MEYQTSSGPLSTTRKDGKIMNDSRRHLFIAGAIASSCLLSPVAVHASSSSETNIHIVKLQQDTDTTRGPSGRAYIQLDRAFALPGVCVYSGGNNTPSGWKLEMNVEHPSFKSMWALAITAYTAGRSIDVYFDDNFGGGTTCRVTSIIIGD
jgi:hypothetical protein